MLEKPSLLEIFEDQARLAARFPRTDVGELGWLPAIDVRELDGEFIVYAALPGVEPQDVVVEVEPGALTLQGRRRERQGEGWTRRELISGPFFRRVDLGNPVRAADISLRRRDGVLEIHLPKERAAEKQQ